MEIRNFEILNYLCEKKNKKLTDISVVAWSMKINSDSSPFNSTETDFSPDSSSAKPFWKYIFSYFVECILKN